MGSHPVAAVLYTFTHRLYTERDKTSNTQNNTKSLEECKPCPIFVGFTLAFVLQLRKSTEKPQGSLRVPVGTMKIHKYTERIYRNKNKNT